MSLFGKKTENVAVIDIRSSSIGAAYVALGPVPTLVYATRTPLDPHATEPVREALPRTLDIVLADLVKTGAPLLRSTTGSAHISHVYVALSAPWQHSVVSSRKIEQDKPFIFTHQSLTEAVGTEVVEKPGMERVRYEVSEPFGKKVNRAELILLSSSIDSDLMECVGKAVRKALHEKNVTFDAFMPQAYSVMRDLYPHQRDFILMDIGNDATEALLAKHGLLVSLTSMPHGVGEITRAARGSGLSSAAVPTSQVLDLAKPTEPASPDNAKEVWLKHMQESLGQIATQEPLPRTVFLLAEENVSDFLRTLLDAPVLRSLWLSDEALSILPILPGQFTTFLGEGSVNPADPALALLALAAAKHG
jgi:hypothetical protein